MRRLGVRAGKRKVWNLPDIRPATNGPDKFSIVSLVSSTTENFSRQLRLVQDDNSKSALAAMS